MQPLRSPLKLQITRYESMDYQTVAGDHFRVRYRA